MKGLARRVFGFFAGTVRRQLIWGVVLVHAVMMTLFVHDLTLRQQAFLIDSQTEEASNLAQTLSVTAISQMLASDLAGLQELAAAVARYPGVAHVMIVHSSGKILAHGDPLRRGQFVADMDRFPRDGAGGPHLLQRSRALVDVVVPVRTDGAPLGWVRVGMAQGANSARLAAISTAGLWYTALAIVAGALIAGLLASGLTRRLTAMRRVADAVSIGDMGVRAPVRQHDELGHLGHAFNFMLDALDARARKEAQLQAALQTEKELAEVTLASIGEAVITTDAAGQVSFLNEVAERYVGWPRAEAIGRPVEEVVRIVDAATGQPAPSPLQDALGAPAAGPRAEALLLQSRGGEAFHIEESVSPIYSPEGGLLGAVLVFRDVTEQHRFQQQLQWQAAHDALTALPNRMLLADRFGRALEKARRNDTLLAVCVLDLDRFKPVNDTHGHEVGDSLLVQVADRLQHQLRAGDTLSRLGGDEFVILFEDVKSAAELHVPLARILDALATPFEIGDRQLKVSASIGVTLYPLDDSDADALMRHADQAMYQAKQAGRNQVAWFDVLQDRSMQESLQIVASVRKALAGGELALFYQPKVDMRSGAVVGMEALLRWHHPERGLVAPGEFLPHVEHSQLIVDIGNWVIEAAMVQALAWRAAGQPWSVSVNIAARQIQMPGFIDRLKALRARYPEAPDHLLEIEILESAALHDVEQARRLILEVQQLGFDFSLDDFGTGYSSLKYLKRLPVNTLKIDQTFVRDLLEDRDDCALVGAVIGLAGAFRRGVIAEGVETWRHAERLLEMGCHVGQGYGIARPMPAGEVLGWARGFTPAFVAGAG